MNQGMDRHIPLVGVTRGMHKLLHVHTYGILVWYIVFYGVHTLHYTNVWNIWNTKDGLPCKTTFRGVRTVNMTLTYVSI